MTYDSAVSMTEIEAKYSVSDRETFDRLKALDRIGRFFIRNGRHRVFHDRFHDTPDRKFLINGYYLRSRLEDGRDGQNWTLKKTGTVLGSIHRRDEMKEDGPAGTTPADIRDVRFSALLSDIAEGYPLSGLPVILSFRQERLFCDVTDGDRHVAVLSYDEVFVRTGGVGGVTDDVSFTEMEIELTGGDENDLAEMDRAILGDAGGGRLRPPVRPCVLSKFEKASLLGGVSPPPAASDDFSAAYDSFSGAVRQPAPPEGSWRGCLSPREKAVLDFILQRPSSFPEASRLPADIYTKRAQVLTDLDAGLSVRAVCAGREVSEMQVSSIVSSFSAMRLGLFPMISKQAPPLYHPFEASPGGFSVVSVEALCRRYGIDADARKNLFDVSGLTGAKSGSYAGASDYGSFLAGRVFDSFLLKGIGAGLFSESGIDPAADILLTTSVEDRSAGEMKTSALILWLDAAGCSSDEEIQKAVSSFPARLTLAEKRDGTAAYRSVCPLVRAWSGERPGSEKTDLTFDGTLDPGDRMADLAGRIFRQQLLDIEKAEPGVLAGNDPEAVHDMRVALRRMKAATLIFGDFLDSGWLSAAGPGIRQTLSEMSRVRDLDVFSENYQKYRQGLCPHPAASDGVSASASDSAASGTDLRPDSLQDAAADPFCRFLAGERAAAFEGLVRYLTSRKYRRFREHLASFPAAGRYPARPPVDKKGNVAPYRIADVLPGILYDRAAGLTACRESLCGPAYRLSRLHRMRIAAKNFRYTLEFFSPLFGKDGAKLIDDFKDFQTLLGDIQDLSVANAFIDDYMNHPALPPETKEALRVYRLYNEAQIRQAVSRFRAVQLPMDHAFFHNRLSRLISLVCR